MTYLIELHIWKQHGLLYKTKPILSRWRHQWRHNMTLEIDPWSNISGIDNTVDTFLGYTDYTEEDLQK